MVVDEGEGAKSNLSRLRPEATTKKNQHVTHALLVSVKTVTAAARRDPLPVLQSTAWQHCIQLEHLMCFRAIFILLTSESSEERVNAYYP